MKQKTKVAENNVVEIAKGTAGKGSKRNAQLVAEFNIVLNKAEQLHLQYKQFDEQYIQRTNDALYALLAEMQRVCLYVQGMAARNAVVEKLRVHLRKEYGIKTQKNSTEIGIIVRYTLRNTRKTAHLYARVLQTAIDAGIAADDLADYIRERGGVENIRKESVDAATREANKQYFNALDYGTRWLFRERRADKALGTVQWSGVTGLQHTRIKDGTQGDFSVLIAMSNRETNETKIVGTLFSTKQITDMVLTNYFNSINLAATEDAGYKRYKAFKKAGVNDYYFGLWASDNGFGTQEEALSNLKELVAVAKQRHERELVEIAERAAKYAAVRNAA